MRRLVTLLVFCFSLSFCFAQQSPITVPISNTGCTVEVFCSPGRFDTYDLEDGSTVFADDCEKDAVTYGIYCVKLKTVLTDLDAAEDTIISYLDFLKLDYGIVKSKGYDKGYKLRKNDATRGIHDSWEDNDKKKWKVRAWTDGRYICVLYMFSSKELPDKKAAVFLEGLRFPGIK